MRLLSLFAGIGGFDLAAEWCGWTVAGQVEIDPWCTRVLEKHWPDVPRIADIRDVRGDEFGAVDVVCGGFPCQPYSHAGKQRGAADDRALWPHMHRVVAAAAPRHVVAENVRGILGLEIDRVHADLEGLGYAVWIAVCPAAGVGALHIRERVWIVGSRPAVDADRHAELRGAEHGGAGSGELVPPGPDASVAVGRRRQDEAPPDQPRLRGAAHGLPAGLDGPLDLFGRGLEHAVPVTVDREVPDRLPRLRALGNAVVPQIPFLIFAAIEAADPA